MKLIIAEKPSLGRNIAAALGAASRRDGYIEGNEYIVTWAFGHLFSLADIEDYSPTEHGRWCMDNLPCFPAQFRFMLRAGKDGKGDPGIKKQFDIIKSLCLRPDVDAIVNAGDADREGEIIVRTCIDHTGVTGKPILRLWLPDQTPETIRAAASDLPADSDYDLLAKEGYARTYIDWLYGVNLTRYATLKTGALLRVGRVIIPIVKAIYDRDMAIRNFVPDTYFQPVSKAETDGRVVELSSKKKFDKNERAKAEDQCLVFNRAGATVTSVKRKKDTLNPGKLYSLSKLQNFLGKKYKMPMDQSLAIVQKLYEEGYLTYPRTNSEYLATAEKGKVQKIIQGVAAKGYPVVFKDKKTIFDDSKIESHSALTPTYKFPSPTALSEDEKKVYSAVLRRFVAVFCAEECVANKTEIKIQCADEEFTLKGTVILEKGWTKYDDYTGKDKELPPLEKGDTVNVDFKPAEKETSPPKHYTIETLNNYLKNPFKEDKAKAAEEENTDDTEDYRAIFEGLELGTEATRTGIIDNARKSGYIELKKDVYYILPGGEYLIETLSYMQISMDKYKTSEMGQALKRVYHGKSTVEEAVELAKGEIASVFGKADSEYDFGFFGQEIGTCPMCGKPIVRFKKSYGCSGYKEGCNFAIWLSMSGRVITLKHAKQLLEQGKTEEIEGFISKKTGKTFSARLKLDGGKAVFDF